MKKIANVLLTLAMLVKLLCVPALAEEQKTAAFTDVPDTAYYYEAVQWAQENDIAEGITQTEFRPDDICTRGQALTFIWRAKGCPEPTVEVNPFTDIDESSPFYKAVLWAYEKEIAKGITETTFEPDTICNNAHIVTFIWRAEGKPAALEASSIADEYPGQYFSDAVAWAEGVGLLMDTYADAFVPGDDSPRANIVTYLYRNLAEQDAPVLYYQGHASVRIVTPENKVIYIDPHVGDGYDLFADLILVTHGHSDHNKLELIENRNEDCRIITHEESNLDGVHQFFDLGYVTVEAVEAENKNHNIKECVGYILTFSNGKSAYFTGDTSTTKQMPKLAEKNIDYAFFCCDGKFNMDREEASECAKMVGAKYNIPYHMAPGSPNNFDRSIAEEFQAENRIIIEPGEELVLK